MMKKITLSILLTLVAGIVFSQQNTSKEYNSIDSALLNPEKVVRLTLNNQKIDIATAIWK